MINTHMNFLNNCGRWWIGAGDLLWLPRQHNQDVGWRENQIGYGHSRHDQADKKWKSKLISIVTKQRLIKSLVLPVTTLGCEAWTLKKEDRLIQAFKKLTISVSENCVMCFRKRAANSVENKVTNTWLYIYRMINTNYRLLKLTHVRYFGNAMRNIEDTKEEGSVMTWLVYTTIQHKTAWQTKNTLAR